jgi:hypothetical protein
MARLRSAGDVEIDLDLSVEEILARRFEAGRRARGALADERRPSRVWSPAERFGPRRSASRARRRRLNE